MSQYSKPAKVGSSISSSKPRCSVCQVVMGYWKEEGIWRCDRCLLVKVPAPTESYKLATTWGRGSIWWEYRFWLSDMSKNRIIITAENMVSTDVTDLISLDMFNMVLESLVSSGGVEVDKFERGESRILSFNRNNTFAGTIKLVRALDDL